MHWKMKKWYLVQNSFLLILLLFTIGACTEQQPEKEVKQSRVEQLPFYQDASFTPHWSNLKELPSDFHQIPPFKLVNQKNQVITEKSFDDKIYVVDFFFTSCPGICPKMTDNMAIVQEAFLEDKEVLLMSHSVTPEQDSVSVLDNYAEAKGVIADKWYLVTGERQEIYNLGRQAYFVEEDLGKKKSMDDFLHTENFVLIDKNRYIRGIYNGLNKVAIHQLIADIKTLKKE